MGASRDFDGVDDNVTLPSNIVYSGSFSVMAWINTDSVSAAEGYIIDRANNGNGLIELYKEGSTLRFRIRGDDNVGITTVSIGETLTTGVWIHVAGVRDTSSDTLKIYFNGGLSNTVTDNTNDVNFTVKPKIGNHLDAPSIAWDGKISYVNMFTKALTIVEINQAMRDPGSIVPMSFFLPLWGANSPEPDLSGNGNNGTVTGAVESFDSPPIAGIWLPHRSRAYHFSQAVSPAPVAVSTARRKLRTLVGVGF